jgi:Protein of unknown function (DUF1573)/HEAT repeats
MSRRFPFHTFAVLAWALIVPVVGAAQATPEAAYPAPRIVLSERDVDLGNLRPAEPLRPVTVTIRNAGDQPLEIRKLRSSCICMTADLSDTHIQAGGTATLRLQGRLLPFEESFDEQALIYSNDPEQPVVKVHVTGPVITPIMVDPEALSIGLTTYRGLVDQRQYPPVRLVAADHAPLGPIRAIPSHPSIHAETRQREDGSYEVDVRIDSNVPLGNFNESVRIETHHSKAPVVEVPIIGRILGDLDPLGHVVDFGFIKEGQTSTAQCVVKRLGRFEKKIEITTAEVKLPVPAQVEVTPAGNDYNVKVRVTSAPAFASLRGVVELHTDNPDQPLVTVEIHGGVLANHPFEQAAAEGSDTRFLAIVKDALDRGERISADDFFAQVLGGVKDQRAVALLLRAATEGEVRTRMRAVELLSTFKTPEVLQRLRRIITDDPHQFVRRLALVGYADAVQNGGIPEMLLALQDDEGWVREDAAEYLGKYGDAKVIPVLRAAQNDPDPEAALAIKSALLMLQSK